MIYVKNQTPTKQLLEQHVKSCLLYSKICRIYSYKAAIALPRMSRPLCGLSVRSLSPGVEQTNLSWLAWPLVHGTVAVGVLSSGAIKWCCVTSWDTHDVAVEPKLWSNDWVVVKFCCITLCFSAHSALYRRVENCICSHPCVSLESCLALNEQLSKKASIGWRSDCAFVANSSLLDCCLANCIKFSSNSVIFCRFNGGRPLPLTLNDSSVFRFPTWCMVSG